MELISTVIFVLLDGICESRSLTYSVLSEGEVRLRGDGSVEGNSGDCPGLMFEGIRQHAKER